MAEPYAAQTDAASPPPDPQQPDNGDMPPTDQPPAQQRPHILELAQQDNLVDLLDEDELMELGRRVVEDHDADKRTMTDWLAFCSDLLPLITQKVERKTFPFDDAANTRLPLITNAVLASHAEEWPEIIRDDEVIKTKIFGIPTDDKDARSERVSKYLNWQFFYGIPEWEAGHDRTVLMKNLLGTVHKKIYWCKESGRYECDVLSAGVVINDNAVSLHTAPRVTHHLDMPWWEVEEKFRAGAWTRQDILKTKSTDSGEPTVDSDKMQVFYEQTRREDIDKDGYPEPYVITVHKDTGKVVCIAPNYTLETIWFKDHGPGKPVAPGEQPPVVAVDSDRGRVRYVKYEFLPSLDGGYWSWGFLRLLGPLNDNCNALVNQILDAGTLASTQGGFFTDALRFSREDGGRVTFQRGEWKKLKGFQGRISDNVFPLPMAQPSPVLFQLLGLLMEVTKESGHQTDLLSGMQPNANAPASSTLALLEQGKKAFGGAYKRHRRSLKAEADAIFDLTFMYEDPVVYQQFCDDPTADPKKDFTRAGIDVVPVAQPEFSTRITRMATGEALSKYIGDPRVNGGAIIKYIVGAITNDKALTAEFVPQEPNITPETMLQKLELQKTQIMSEMDVQMKKYNVDAAMIAVELQKMLFNTAVFNAQAAAVEAGAKILPIDPILPEPPVAGMSSGAAPPPPSSMPTPPGQPGPGGPPPPGAPPQ